MGTIARGAFLLFAIAVALRRANASFGRDASTGAQDGTIVSPDRLVIPRSPVKRWMRPAAWLITPIAAPAWLAESVARRCMRRFWEFDMWSGTFYLVGVIGAGLLLLVSDSLVLRAFGFYVLTAAEFLGLLVVGALPAGQFAGYAPSLRALARRKAVSVPAFSERTAVAQPLWAAFTAYIYTTLYFAICGRLVFEFDHRAFAGIHHAGNVRIMFEFYYATFASMVTLGYVPSVTPEAPVAQLLYMAQFAISLGFLVLVFSVAVDRLVSRRA